MRNPTARVVSFGFPPLVLLSCRFLLAGGQCGPGGSGNRRPGRGRVGRWDEVARDPVGGGVAEFPKEDAYRPLGTRGHLGKVVSK